jgi:hypothetical protein
VASFLSYYPGAAKKIHLLFLYAVVEFHLLSYETAPFREETGWDRDVAGIEPEEELWVADRNRWRASYGAMFAHFRHGFDICLLVQ